MSRRFTDVDARLDSMDRQFNVLTSEMNRRFESLNDKMDSIAKGLNKRIDLSVGRLDVDVGRLDGELKQHFAIFHEHEERLKTLERATRGESLG